MGLKKREKWVKGTLTSSISFFNTVNFFIFYFTLIIFSLSLFGVFGQTVDFLYLGIGITSARIVFYFT